MYFNCSICEGNNSSVELLALVWAQFGVEYFLQGLHHVLLTHVCLPLLDFSLGIAQGFLAHHEHAVIVDRLELTVKAKA